LKRLRKSASEAEKLVAKLSLPTAPRVTIHSVVVVDPEHVPPSATIMVRATQRWVENGEECQDDEWLTSNMLYERLGWLEGVAMSGLRAPEIDTQYGGDAWVAAAVAHCDLIPPQGTVRRVVAVVHGEAKNARALRDAEQAAQISQKDAKKWSEELESAQTELSLLRKQLRNQQKKVEDLCDDLSHARGELEETKAKLKGYNFTQQKTRQAECWADTPSGTGAELDLTCLGRVAQIVSKSFDDAVQAIDNKQKSLELAGVNVSPRDEDSEA